MAPTGIELEDLNKVVEEIALAFEKLIRDMAFGERLEAALPPAAEELDGALSADADDLDAAADETIELLKICAKTARAEHEAREAVAARLEAAPNVDRVVLEDSGGRRRQPGDRFNEFLLGLAERAGFRGTMTEVTAAFGPGVPRLIADLVEARMDLRHKRLVAAIARATCAAAIRRLGEMQTKL